VDVLVQQMDQVSDYHGSQPFETTLRTFAASPEKRSSGESDRKSVEFVTHSADLLELNRHGAIFQAHQTAKVESQKLPAIFFATHTYRNPA
jgi:hypothetical protein